MKFRFLAPLFACLSLWLALPAHAAGLGDPEADVALRLVESSAKQAVPADDPRVAKVRGQLAQVVKATGENEQAVAHACNRNARYLFDVAQLRVSPLEVLEALATQARGSRPLTEMTGRYFDLRTKQKLDHAGALAALK